MKGEEKTLHDKSRLKELMITTSLTEDPGRKTSEGRERQLYPRDYREEITKKASKAAG